MARSLISSALLAAGLAVAAAVCVAAEPAATTPPLGIGAPVGARELSELDITVFPDGSGLPVGRGTAVQGAPLYAAQCAACHGDEGQGIGDFPALVGGIGTLADKRPLLTVGSYWPTATTLFDYVRRAMPYQSAGELRDGEVYALSAWILAMNGIIGKNEVLDRRRLPRLRMPNRDGFVPGR
jgi:S-disulfanyl-L-cysteine oxidoreductase SoxD